MTPDHKKRPPHQIRTHFLVKLLREICFSNLLSLSVFYSYFHVLFSNRAHCGVSLVITAPTVSTEPLLRFFSGFAKAESASLQARSPHPPPPPPTLPFFFLFFSIPL